jgi:hypothetical protein
MIRLLMYTLILLGFGSGCTLFDMYVVAAVDPTGATLFKALVFVVVNFAGMLLQYNSLTEGA